MTQSLPVCAFTENQAPSLPLRARRTHAKEEPGYYGAGGGGRTHTAFRLLDFESSASADSATPATLI